MHDGRPSARSQNRAEAQASLGGIMKNQSALLIVVAALAVCVLVLFYFIGKTEFGPSKPIPVAQRVVEAPSKAPAPPAAKPAAAKGPQSAAHKATAAKPGADKAAGKAEDKAVQAAATPKSGSEDEEETSLVFKSEEEIAKWIQDKGGIVAAYTAAGTEDRQEIIDYLMGEDKLRDQLAALLPIETDSDVRAYMLERVEPKGYFGEIPGTAAPEQTPNDSETTDEEEEKPDTELMALLDADPASPMNSAEWMARLQLAQMAGEEYGLKWVRKALAEGPDDPELRALASSLTITLASGLDSVTEQESGSAENYLREHLSDEGLSADVKIQAYHALYFAKDREAAKAYLEQSVAREQDQRVVAVLRQLLARWN